MTVRCDTCGRLSDADEGAVCDGPWRCSGTLREHQCGGPREACGVAGCDECGAKEATAAKIRRLEAESKEWRARFRQEEWRRYLAEDHGEHVNCDWTERERGVLKLEREAAEADRRAAEAERNAAEADRDDLRARLDKAIELVRALAEGERWARGAAADFLAKEQDLEDER